MSLPKRVITKLVDHANPLLSLAHRCLPNTLEQHAILFFVNQLAKEFIQQGDMNFMEGKIAKLRVSDIDLHWFFTKPQGQDRLTVVNLNSDAVADVTFSGSLDALVLMASQKMDPDTLFFNRELMISGDTELGLEIKNLIDQFEISKLASPVKTVLNVWSDHLLEAKYA